MSYVECKATEQRAVDMALESRLRELETQVSMLAGGRERPAGIAIIAFSGDMDKLLSAFMLANGAASMGIPVLMFFTFWALPALKRKTVFHGKRALERLVAALLPAGPHRMCPSKWRMLGLGRGLLCALLRRRCMKDLEDLRNVALELKVRIMVCEPVMNMMTLTRDELIEGVEFGGVASFLDEALDRSITLFI